jgi:phage-related protein (TIGR01555 family)
LARPPAEVLEAHGRALAAVADSALGRDALKALASRDSLPRHAVELGQYPVGQFVGYDLLSRLAENGLIQACVSSVVDDMMRNWIEVVRRSGPDGAPTGPDATLARLEDGLERFRVRDLLRRAALCCGYFGGCLLFVDTGGFDLAEPLDATPASGELRVGGLRSLRLVEPVNVCPGLYNSWDPLADDFYEPESWIVAARRVHSSRLIRVHSGLPPQVLLPAYNFFGVPRAQVLWDYVMHFQRDRISASDLLRKFSIKILKTNMSQVLTGGVGDDLLKRLELLRRLGDNDSVMALDKEQEEFVKVESSLAGVTDIVQQALELICAVNGTPVVKTLGLSPKGFNATGEIDLRNYYDRVSAMQEQQLAPALEAILRLLQLHLFGTVDDTIGFNFKPLSEDDKQIKATVQKMRADVASIYLDRGVVAPDEVRQNLIADKDSGFDDVELEDLPESPYMAGPAPPGLEGSVEGGAERGTSAPSVPEEPPPQQQALNGPQITSLLEIIAQVAAGQLPRESAKAIISAAFNMDADQAETILGEVGRTFVPRAAPEASGPMEEQSWGG